MQTWLDTTMAPLYFQFEHWKMASRKQRYLCQKFLLPIPIHTWKISWIERLIYFLRPHMANRSHLTLMWQSNVCHGIVFIISFCFCRLAIQSQAFEKNPPVHPFDLTDRKKRTSIQPYDLTVRKEFASIQAFEKNLHLFSRSTWLFKKNYICPAVQFNRSKKICMRSVIQPIRFKQLV